MPEPPPFDRDPRPKGPPLNRSATDAPARPPRPARARRSLALLAASAALAALSPAGAHAQALPASVVTALTLSDGDRTAIGDYVRGHLAGLSSEKPEEIREARGALLAPLRTQGVSGSFRTELSTQLGEPLGRLAADKRDEVAINALRIAGELGTGRGLELLNAGLRDARQSVRVMAAMGYGRAINTVRTGNRAMLDSQVRAALAAVREAITERQDPLVADALVGSLADMATLPGNVEPPMRDLQTAAAGAMVDALAALAPKARPEHAAALSRATGALVGVITDAGSPVNQNQDVLRRGAGLAGDALVFVSRRLGSGELPQNERERLAVLADQSARVIQLAGGKLGASSLPQATLRTSVLSGEPGGYNSDAAKYTSALSAPPFGLPQDRFKRPG